MRTVFDDIHYALRTLHKSPGFTLVAILTLAIAIGATSSVFSALNAVLLRELPFKNASSLVILWGTQRHENVLGQREQICFPDVDDWNKLNHSFEDIAAFGAWQEAVTGNGEAERISTLRVSPSFFHVMGAAPLLGRTFAPNENLDSRATVAVLSYGLWQRKFAQDPNVIGKTLSLNSSIFTIVGVMPRDFRSLPASIVDTPVELYKPLSRVYLDQIRDGHHLRAIGRLKPGVTLASAQAEMDVVSKQLERRYPETNTGAGVRLVKLHDDLVRNVRTGLWVLQVAVCLVVMIACANLANLLLARSSARSKEIAIRAAIGASRLRLMRQMLTESLVLAALGGAAGLALALWGAQAIEAVGAKVLPELGSVSIDSRVLAFTAVLSLVSGIVFGLAPAANISVGSLAEALRSSVRGTTASGFGKRFRDALVIAEMALALLLMVGAGLLINSFRHLRSIDPGFASHHILTAGISMPEAKYPSEQLRSRFVHELVAQVRRQPGVQHASAVSVLPESSNFNQMAMDIQGRVFARGESPSLDQYDVTPDYFRELRIPLLQGRWFSEQDDRNHAYVALINQTAARRLWQSRNPIGEKVHTGAASEPWRTIVGVVGDVYQYGLDSQKTMQIYYPYQQDANFDLTLMVQSEMSPAALASELRQAVRAIDKDLPLSDVQPLDQVLSDSVAGRRFSMLLLALFAGAALVLASVGIYGVISYSVTQRLNEFGIRVALGANRGDILRQVLRQSTLLAAGGTAIGLAAAFGLTRLLASLLFGVSATDLPTFAVVAAVLMGVALAATINPALRATQTDPMSAMRNE